MAVRHIPQPPSLSAKVSSRVNLDHRPSLTLPRRILDAISPEVDAAHGGLDDDDDDPTGPAPIIIGGNGQPSAAVQSSSHAQFEKYIKNLSPLFEVEHRLLLQLSDPEDNVDKEATHLPGLSSSYPSSSFPIDLQNGAFHNGDALPKIVIPSGSRSLPNSPVSTNEPTVRTTSNWKKAFGLVNIQGKKSDDSGELQGWWEDPDDPVHIINRCAPYISQLWRDQQVRQKLNEKRIRLEESSGL